MIASSLLYWVIHHSIPMLFVAPQSISWTVDWIARDTLDYLDLQWEQRYLCQLTNTSSSWWRWGTRVLARRLRVLGSLEVAVCRDSSSYWRCNPPILGFQRTKRTIASMQNVMIDDRHCPGPPARTRILSRSIDGSQHSYGPFGS